MNNSAKLLKMKELGQISQELLLLYGISGEMPSRTEYMRMTTEERKLLWHKRMQEQYGYNWRSLFKTVPKLLEQSNIHDWKIEGF